MGPASAPVLLGQPQEIGREGAKPASSALTNASSSPAASSGLVALSRPMVVMRSAPGGAEQNDPAPCVGYTGVASGKVSSRSREAYCDRASGSVCSGRDRSVWAAAPTSSYTPGEHPPRMHPVEQQVDQVLSGVAGGGPGPQRQPAQVHFIAVGQPMVGEGPASGCGREDLRAVVGRQLPRPRQEVGMQVRVSGDAAVSPCRAAAAPSGSSLQLLAPLGQDDASRGLDQGQVGERLGEVAEGMAGVGVELLGEQPQGGVDAQQPLPSGRVPGPARPPPPGPTPARTSRSGRSPSLPLRPSSVSSVL